MVNCALGDSLLDTNPAEAAGFYRAALATRPMVGVIHLKLGRALFRAGQVADKQTEEAEPERVGEAHDLGTGVGVCALYQRASASSSAALSGPIAARITGTSRRPSRSLPIPAFLAPMPSASRPPVRVC